MTYGGSFEYVRHKPKHKPKHTGKIFLLLSVILLAGSLGIAIISMYAGWKVIHPAKAEVLAFHSNIVPSHKNIIFYDADFKRELNGWYFDTPESHKVIIISHDYGKNRLQFGEKTVDLIKGLQAGGYDVFIFDFGNSGNSQGNVSTFGYLEKRDLMGAIRYITTTEGPVDKLALLGFGTGAVTSICTAGEEMAVDAVIADSPFSDLKEYWQSSLDKYTDLPPIPFNYTSSLALEKLLGVVRSSVSPKKSLSANPDIPLLLIHSAKDPLVSVKNSRELASINPGYVLWEADSSEHIGAYTQDPGEYVKKVLDFLNRNLGK